MTTLAGSEWTPGTSLGEEVVDLTLQRLIMISGANRDFALSHIDDVSARAGGAPAAYADSLYIFTHLESLLLNFGGSRAQVRKLGPLHIRDFIVHGRPAVARGRITEVSRSTDFLGRPCELVEATVEIVQDGDRVAVSGQASFTVPLAGQEG